MVEADEIVWFITGARFDKDSKTKKIIDFQTRTWTWVSTKEQAIKIVENNTTNIAEDGYYKWCAIEGIASGILSLLEPDNQIFYRWSIRQKKYTKCHEMPEELVKYFNKNYIFPQFALVG
jgi:hypothetical protein